jgi:hypothetical protein
MELIRNVLVSLFVMITITMMVIVFAYVKIGPVEETQVSETTVVELNKVDPQ